MPWWVVVYITFFTVILLVNSAFWILFRQKVLLIIYQLSAGFYMLFLIIAYWTPFIKQNLSIFNVAAFLCVLAVDFYFTMLKSKKKIDIKQLLPDIDDEVAMLARMFPVVEIAQAVPVLITSPAYIFGALILIDLARSSS